MAPIALTTLGMLCAACADVMSMLVMVTSSGISCRLSNLVVIVWFRNVSVSSSVDATGVLLNSFTIHRRTFSPRLHELRTSAHGIFCRVDTQDEYEMPYSSTPRASFAKSRSTQAHTEYSDAFTDAKSAYFIDGVEHSHLRFACSATILRYSSRSAGETSCTRLCCARPYTVARLTAAARITRYFLRFRRRRGEGSVASGVVVLRAGIARTVRQSRGA